MLHFSQFVWPLSCSVWDVFNNFLLIDATDRIKISSDQKRFFIALSLYPLSFFANTPFKCITSWWSKYIFFSWQWLNSILIYIYHTVHPLHIHYIYVFILYVSFYYLCPSWNTKAVPKIWSKNLYFFNPWIFATWIYKPLILQTFDLAPLLVRIFKGLRHQFSRGLEIRNFNDHVLLFLFFYLYNNNVEKI